MAQSFLLTNLCSKIRIKTSDKHVIQAFSAFYTHPAMINEDAWHLVRSGTLPILVDQDTMSIMKGLVCEWGFDASTDAILTLKLTCLEQDKDAREALLKEKLEYAKRTKAEMDHFFDRAKVEELTNAMDAISCSEPADSDLIENGPTLERIPEAIE